jgi:hypothetical protein
MSIETQNGDYNLYAGATVYNKTAAADGEYYLDIRIGDGTKNLNTAASTLTVTVTVGGATVNGGSQSIAKAATVLRVCLPSTFLFVANGGAITIVISSDNSNDTDVDVTVTPRLIRSNLVQWLGVAPLALTSQRVNANVGACGGSTKAISEDGTGIDIIYGVCAITGLDVSTDQTDSSGHYVIEPNVSGNISWKHGAYRITGASGAWNLQLVADGTILYRCEDTTPLGSWSDYQEPYDGSCSVVMPTTALPGDTRTVLGSSPTSLLEDAANAELYAWVSASQTAAAAIRTAVGLALANLDTQLAGLLSATQNIQNNTFIASNIPQVLERPDSGSKTIQIVVTFADETGTAKNLDSGNPTLSLVDEDDTDLSSRLGGWANPATGKYTIDYTNSVTDAVGILRWEVTGTVNSKLRRYVAITQIVDTTAVDFTSADRTKLETLATDYSTARAAKLDYLTGNVALDSTVAKEATLATLPAAVWASTTRTLTSLSSLVASIASAVWSAATRTLTGSAIGVGSTAARNQADAQYVVFVGGTLGLYRRVLGWDGDDLQQADVSSIAYTIYSLDEDDARTEVTGHVAQSLTVEDVLWDAVQTDAWSSDWNFKFIPSIASHSAFPTVGTTYLVEVTFTLSEGEKIIVRFRVRAK